MEIKFFGSKTKGTCAPDKFPGAGRGSASYPPTKSTPRSEYVKDFSQTIKEFFNYFPELAGKKIDSHLCLLKHRRKHH